MMMPVVACPLPFKVCRSKMGGPLSLFYAAQLVLL